MKKTIVFTLSALLLLIGISATPLSDKSTVEVTIKDLRNKEGKVVLAVYRNQQSFKDEKPLMKKSYSKATVKDGKLTVKIELPNGECGIALLDDENENQEMDYGIMLPKEGFGFSNYYHSGMSMPKFEDFKFNAGGNGGNKVEIKLRYM